MRAVQSPLDEELTEFELELLAAPVEDRPVSEAFRVLALPPCSLTVVPTLERRRDPLWSEPDRRPPSPWPDRSVRRLVDLPYDVAVVVLDELAHDKTTSFPFDCHATAAEEERCFRGALRFHRGGRRMFVELVVARWSATRTELRLQPDGRRARLSVPPRFFEMASAITDRLGRVIESRTAA
jgi:hypothetical protein